MDSYESKNNSEKLDPEYEASLKLQAYLYSCFCMHNTGERLKKKKRPKAQRVFQKILNSM